jgi:hypothetical protein
MYNINKNNLLLNNNFELSFFLRSQLVSNCMVEFSQSVIL